MAEIPIECQPGAIYRRAYLATDATTFVTGDTVCINTATGLAVVGGDAANRIFVGICDESIVTVTSDYVMVNCGGDVTYPAVGLAQTDVGASMYVGSAQAMEPVAGVANYVVMGRLVKYTSATEGVVNITCPELLATASASVTFATGATVAKLAALASANIGAALDEAYENCDDLFCEDGDGVTTVSPGANRTVFAKAVNATGCGVSYRVRGDGAGTTATYLLSASADYAAGGYPVVSDSDPTNLTLLPDFYGPDAIGAAANGWAYREYYQLNSGINTTTIAAGNVIFCGALGIPAIAKPAGSACCIVGKALSAEADGEILFTLPYQPNPMFTIAHTVTAGEAAANLADIDTGWGVNPLSFAYVITRAGIVVSGKDEVTTIGTGGAGTIRIADGAATYVTTQNDVIYLQAWAY
jgi:hypothetical protein